MSTTTKPIPFLPGYTSHHITRVDHRKPHSLDYKNGYSLKKKPFVGIGGESILHNELEKLHLQAELSAAAASNYKYGQEKQFKKEAPKPFIPAHVYYDKLVLCFNAYFKQTVYDSIEQYILRHVRILVYLEDDSIMVMETPQENSGIPQGALIMRQRLPKNESEFYTPLDFNLGQNITFYGKTFHITDCDEFTKKYLTQTLKITLNPAESMPNDPYLESRNKPKTNTATKVQHNDRLKKFLLNDRKVLRFYCRWDDRESMYGELRDFVIHYFLVDDSLEVREVQKPNQGRDACAVLLRRQQVPKKYESYESFVSNAKITWRDIHMGQTVNVLGRSFLVYDCDEFTRKYYKDNLGYSDSELKPSIAKADTSDKQIEREIPPYNGFGSLEDSMGSCKYLVLKPPKKDFIKMLENEHKVLRFVAIMESKHRENANRQFVIAYRLADDMMTIYEPPQRNAGFLGGKFLERTRALKPGHTLQNPSYYNADDLYIGAKIQVNHYKFILVDADDFVFKYMEENSDEFPQSNLNVILEKIRKNGPSAGEQASKTFKALDSEGRGFLGKQSFIQAVVSSIPNLSKHASLLTFE